MQMNEMFEWIFCRNESYDRKSDRESSSSKFNLAAGQHAFQENTYKKITACDVCRDILRGISSVNLNLLNLLNEFSRVKICTSYTKYRAF